MRGVAVDATSGTVLLVDHRGNPLTAGLMYDDTRAADMVERVNEVGAAVWRDLGYQRMQPAWALPKLLWLLREHPDLIAGARLAHQNDFINSRLVGHEVPTDLSNALKTGAHLIEETWPTDVFDALGVPGHLLPALVRPGTRIGTVCAAAAEATGIPVGTPVVSGATDGCAAQLGAGALSVGSWNSVLGTTLVLKGVTRELIRDPLGAVYSHKAPNGDWLPGGASSTGAGAVSRDFPGADLDELNRRAARHEPAGALAYPLVSAGERFPFVAPQARGFLLGDTGRRRRPLRRRAAGRRVRRTALLRLPRPARRTPGRGPHPDRRRDEEHLLVSAARRHPRPPGHPARHRRSRARDGRAGRLTGPRGRRRRRRDGPHPRGHRTAARFARPVRRAVPAVRGRTRRPRLACGPTPRTTPEKGPTR